MLRADDSLTRLMYTLGENLIKDDRADLGYGTYYGRSNHRYHGKSSPHHPSPFHHYQVGTVLCLLAQVLRLSNVASEAQEATADINFEEESWDLDNHESY